MTPIDHKAVMADVLKACDKHNLSNDSATKCLIYVCSKLIQKRYGVSSTEGAQLLSEAALEFKSMIEKVERMTKNKG